MRRGINLRDAQQNAMGFLVSQISHIEREVVKQKYPDIQYPSLIPVDTSANEWAKSVTFFSVDQFGRADWFHQAANDIPMADVKREKFESTIEMAGIGYRYNLEELGQAMMIPGMNLTADRAAAARRAYEEFVDDVALRGNVEKEWQGLINHSAVDVSNVLADGNGGSMSWDDKEPDQVLRDVNAAITGLYVDTLTIEMADTILLPVGAFTSIATRRLGDTPMTILQFLMQFNTYTAQTRQQLDIRTVRGLETAGAGGTGRMVVYRRSPDVLKLHIPMPHRWLEVWRRGPITFDVPGIFRLGGLEIRRPKAIRYVDGIMEAAYE